MTDKMIKRLLILKDSFDSHTEIYFDIDSVLIQNRSKNLAKSCPWGFVRQGLES